MRRLSDAYSTWVGVVSVSLHTLKRANGAYFEAGDFHPWTFVQKYSPVGRGDRNRSFLIFGANQPFQLPIRVRPSQASGEPAAWIANRVFIVGPKSSASHVVLRPGGTTAVHQSKTFTVLDLYLYFQISSLTRQGYFADTILNDSSCRVLDVMIVPSNDGVVGQYGLKQWSLVAATDRLDYALRGGISKGGKMQHRYISFPLQAEATRLLNGEDIGAQELQDLDFNDHLYIRPRLAPVNPPKGWIAPGRLVQQVAGPSASSSSSLPKPPLPSDLADELRVVSPVDHSRNRADPQSDRRSHRIDQRGKSLSCSAIHETEYGRRLTTQDCKKGMTHIVPGLDTAVKLDEHFKVSLVFCTKLTQDLRIRPHHGLDGRCFQEVRV